MRTGIATLIVYSLFTPWATGQSSFCPPLEPPAPGQKVIRIVAVSQLMTELRRARPDTTFLLEDGLYLLRDNESFEVHTPRLTFRSASGDREAVIIEGGYNNFSVNVDDCTIADMTLRKPRWHNVQVRGERGLVRPVLYNLILQDAGQQLVKVSAGDGLAGKFGDDGLVACCTIEYTDRHPGNYTNGVDIIAGKGWVVRDNLFRRIIGTPGPTGPTVLIWRNALDSVVVRNVLIDCFRGITLGLTTPNHLSRGGAGVEYDHQNGLIESNVIIALNERVDAPIETSYARNTRIYHNTIFTKSSMVTWSIEYRFPGTTAVIKNNLTNRQVLNRSPGEAEAVVEGNITSAQQSWFHNLGSGNYHLRSTTRAIDAGVMLGESFSDIDGGPRPVGAAPDCGADEYGSPDPGQGVLFIRGDANADGSVDISDVVRGLLILFGAEPAPDCHQSLDVDDDQQVDITDSVYLLEHLYRVGPPPSGPYPHCGLDAELSAVLPCEVHGPCR